jgi:diguanylate cyclase (GGDEF)-like protein
MSQVQAPPEAADKPRVLIVDDERFNLNTLNGLLRDDYRIMVATHGEQGLKAALSGRPDLILLDITMPDLDGYEVCRRLKGDPLTQGIPVIFITALSDAADETRGLELGAADYITKPFHPAVVRARVRTQMRLKQQSDLLESYAFRDGLTSLANRRAFDERSAQEWSRSQRTGRPLSVILLDVDHFKLFNDHAGHAAGDDCLKGVARCLEAPMRRATDLVARYGGEEFVVLLPDADHANALAVGEALRAGVAGSSMAHPASPVAPHVTISVGVATSVAKQGSTFAHLLQQADQALYGCKRGGRNRVQGVEVG